MAEGILRYFSNNRGFEDNLNFYRQAGVGINVIFACIVSR